MKHDAGSSFPMKRLKYLAALRSSRNVEKEVERPYIGLENIESWTGRLVENIAANNVLTSSVANKIESMSNRFELGDVLFGKLRPYLAKAWIAAFPGRCTTEALVMEPHSIEPRFLRDVCLSPAFIGAIDASTFGSRMPRAEWDIIGNMLIPAPDREIQVDIADYLERETEQLDALIAAKKRLLELLAEKRQAMMIRAVSLGLDPNVRLKPSGIEWLGDVPAHWEVVSVKSAYSIQLGRMLQSHPIGLYDIEVPYLKAQHVQWLSIRTEDAPKMWINPQELHQYSIREGDLLVCEGGEGGRCGLVGNIKENYIIQNALHRVRELGKGRNDYLQYVLISISATEWFQSINNKATITHFTKDKFSALKIPLPPLAEQIAISGYLDKETALLDVLASKIRKTIDLIKERRAALISAVVTGNIDVGVSPCK